VRAVERGGQRSDRTREAQPVDERACSKFDTGMRLTLRHIPRKIRP
jgi:hypothetical protein